MQLKVLVVEDEPDIARLISSVLKREGCVCKCVGDGATALETASHGDFGMVITDIVLPGMSGLDFCEELKKIKPDIPLLIVSAHREFDYAVRALKVGASGFLVKPFSNADLIRQVRHIKKICSFRVARKPALRHSTYEKHEIAFITSELMKKDNLFNTARYFAEQFGIEADRGKTDRLKFSLAIHEALRNAVEHGNLGVPSSLKQSASLNDFGEGYEKVLNERLNDPILSSKKVFVRFYRFAGKLELSICDEGSGFDHKRTLDRVMSGKASLDEVHGRGLVIIKSYMDEISFNEKGNEISLTREI